MALDAYNRTPMPERSRRSSKRALAVRMMAAETVWLDGHLRWHDGRIAWDSGHGLVVPTVADIALAQRRLYKIRRYPVVADLALGDGQAWMERRAARLALAKRLHAMEAPDLPSLVRQAHNHDPLAVQRLVDLLLAEALCLNQLPVSPAAALIACGQQAAVPLRVLLEDETVPMAGRALAALTLGALYGTANREGGTGVDVPELGASPWLRRAYEWGVRSGLPATPALIVALLAGEDGHALAQRYLRALQRSGYFALPHDMLRELLAADVPATQVVALAEAVADAEPLAKRILQWRNELADVRLSHRRTVAASLRCQRQRMLSEVTELLHSYTRATRDPDVVFLLVSFVDAMLDLAPPSPKLSSTIALVLRQGLTLPPSLQRPFLLLLIEQHERLWDRSGMPKSNKRSKLSSWLDERYSMYVEPLLLLLRVSGDAALIRAAVALDVYRLLARFRWHDPDLLRVALALLRDIYMEGEEYTASQLCRRLRRCSSASEARTLFLPLIHALLPVSRSMRNHFMQEVLAVVPCTRQGLRAALLRITRFMPRLIGFDNIDQNEDCACRALIAAVLAIGTSVPDQADDWLDWLMSYLVEHGRTAKRTWEEVEALELAVPMAVALSDGNLNRFQMIVRTAVEHELGRRLYRLEQGITLLSRFPTLRAALGLLFPRQPHRCARLIERVGLAARLGPDALAPLLELETGYEAGDPSHNKARRTDNLLVVDPQGPGRAWHELLSLVPDLASTAATYLHAQWLLGGSFDLPPGLGRVLEQPRKLERELAYLEQLLASEPERIDLLARVNNLRARLADREPLLRSVCDEVRERLTRLAAEAQLKAAEQQVLACYRARLASVAGPLPDGLCLDDNLLNATLLTVDIEQNRRLLRRLLRAHISGDHDWRERHPANVAFLKQVAERGGNVAEWLGGHPGTYRCPGVAGGRVRLHLARDPLHILQMGNYFGTCLSFGQVNAFSTVANACELNKRVIYATDGTGRVIGRKLIAINAEGGLVGFRTYSQLDDEKAREALGDIIHRYAVAFAERCNIPLADSGSVSTLFAEAWYDDGMWPWDDQLSPKTKSKTA